MKYLSYIPREVGYKSIHSFIRREFIAGTPGYSRGDLFIVGWDGDDYPKKGLILEEAIDASYLVAKESINLSLLISFSNRGRRLDAPPVYNRAENDINPDHCKRVKIKDEKHAISRFCTLAGLSVPDRSIHAHLRQPNAERICDFKGMINTKKNGGDGKRLLANIENCFEISGEFLIEDDEKLTQALKKGCGSRRSYGFGLIFVKESSEDEEVGLIW